MKMRLAYAFVSSVVLSLMCAGYSEAQIDPGIIPSPGVASTFSVDRLDEIRQGVADAFASVDCGKILAKIGKKRYYC